MITGIVCSITRPGDKVLLWRLDLVKNDGSSQYLSVIGDTPEGIEEAKVVQGLRALADTIEKGSA